VPNLSVLSTTNEQFFFYDMFTCLVVLDIHQSTYMITWCSATFISVEYNKWTLFRLPYVCLLGSTGYTPINVHDNITQWKIYQCWVQHVNTFPPRIFLWYQMYGQSMYMITLHSGIFISVEYTKWTLFLLGYVCLLGVHQST